METVTKKSIVAFYLEFVNNFLTIERMAEYYEMPVEDCKYLIELGKRYNEDYASVKVHPSIQEFPTIK